MHSNMKLSHAPLSIIAGVGTLVVLLAVGCAGGGDKTADTAAAGPAPARGGAPVSASSSAAPTTKPDSAGLTDANIMAAEMGSDSAEIAVARSVEARASGAPTRMYAALLIRDHGKSLSEVRALSGKLGVAPVAAANDTTAMATAHVLARLSRLTGRALDTAFVNHEVEDHQHDIAEAHRMSAAAQNPQVKALVDKSLPELQEHLNRAQALSASGAR